MTEVPRGPIRIRKPCSIPWDELESTPDSNRRWCGDCRRQVVDLSGETERGARAILRRARGRTCISLRYRPDGTVVHAPSRLSRLRRRLATIGAAASTALLAACPGGRSDSPPEPESQDGRVDAPVAPELPEGAAKSSNLEDLTRR